MVYEYTKPRAPIAAMYGSPGPSYALPGLVGQRQHDPRSVHNKAPSYPFGLRHGKWKDDCGPGPAYKPEARIFKDGKDGTPSYSLYSRHDIGSKNVAPGPGAYAPEAAGSTAKPRAPAYSMASRHALRSADNAPGPNKYNLPGMVGKTIESSKSQAPAYSLRSRNNNGGFAEDLKKTPGPGTYNRSEKNAAPSYSMTGRNMMPGDSTQKPGPGTHSPEKVYAHKPKAPGYSFGIRHTQYEAPLIVEVRD